MIVGLGIAGVGGGGGAEGGDGKAVGTVDGEVVVGEIGGGERAGAHDFLGDKVERRGRSEGERAERCA